MTGVAPSTAIVTIQPVLTDAGRLALAGFLTGSRGLTRKPARWTCASSPPGAVLASCHCSVGRADIEGFARELEARVGPAPRSSGGYAPSPGSTSTRWKKNSSTIPRPPRCGRLRVGYECHGVALDRNELGALPGARSPDPDRHPEGRRSGDHPAGGAHRPGNRPGHRRAHRRGGVPGHGRSAAGPAWRRPDRPQGRPPCRDRQDRHALRAQARGTAALDAGSPCATSKTPPHTLTREPRCGRARSSLDRHATCIVAVSLAGAAR